MKKTLSIFVTFVSFFTAFIFNIGCVKDFSFEQTPVDTTTVPITQQPADRSYCKACNTTADPDSSWQATIDGVIYCGQAAKAIITLERTSFTFFGPSFCSSDSGFVASVYLDNEPLDSDRKNVRARMACYYYDRLGPSYVYMSDASQPLQLFISTYEHSTGVARGTFSGFVLDGNGIRREIRNGRFRIKL